MTKTKPNRILLVTGMSGAGKSTALKTLEDMGWEAVDNLPFVLLDRLLATPAPEGSDQGRPLAIGIDGRTRGFSAVAIVERMKQMQEDQKRNIAVLFLDCSGAELERRFSETRRRHPLAADRPASDGIAREREMIAPLRRWAEHVIDTTANSSNDLKQDIRARFATQDDGGTTLSIMSFGFARGLPRNADLVLDMRFLRNPYWDEKLRPMSGKDEPVSLYIRGDPAYRESIEKIESLLLTLIPRYAAEGKAYVTVAFGCTGGQHRSVHVAEFICSRLKGAGYSPALTHRDIGHRTSGALEEDLEDVGRKSGSQTGK
jgi:RNase adapter protein RapZ